MKKLILLFATFLLLQLNTLAQQGWFEQTSGTTSSLNSVHFTDNNTGWAVGGGGTILKTTDGGTNWNSQTIGTVDELYSVHFTDNNTGWVVDWNGTILKTTDGGQNWNSQTSGTTCNLWSVHFTDSYTGWVVGIGEWYGTILKTTDGGTNWTSQTSGTTNQLTSVHFTDGNTGWVVGYGSDYESIILNTTDGGINWNIQYYGEIPDLHSVHFADDNTGWAAGYLGTILNTTDGGTSWNYQTSGTTDFLWSIHFTDNNTGWAVGSEGTILNTTDGGTNWNPQTSGTISNLRSIYFTDNNTGWAVGGGGTILKTTTGGVIPVELTAFTASTSEGKVYLNWTTATETNNSGFEIERKIINVGDGAWITIGFTEGNGTTTEIQSYQYIDNISDIKATSLCYRLKQIDYNGSYEYSYEVLVENPAPVNFALQQNYPNPFNPVTTISYSLPIKSQVELVIYNTLGERIKRLVNSEKEAGHHRVEFNAISLSSGIYFYRLQAGSFVETKKMILLR